METGFTLFPVTPDRRRHQCLYRAWEHFWRKFSPWVNHQVRCVHLMLADAIKNTMISESKNNDSTFQIPSNQSIRQFVLVKRLDELVEAVESERLIDLFKKCKFEFHGHERSKGWFEGSDALWLNRSPVKQSDFSANIDHIRSRFYTPGTDSGPIVAWFHVLRASTIPGRDYEIPLFSDPARYKRDRFDCPKCAALFGYVFWDRKRLERMWQAERSMPSLKEMRSEVGEGIPIDGRSFARNYCLDPDQDCTCAHVYWQTTKIVRFNVE
ncbi:hypothetical protein F4778DRAFT_380306 [Xylariomycetidae sp. FL2044]|nr:hypothetical protein F4778DRAFT_380306 [Xylariomycetidae sp. FL2044]